MRAAAGGAGGRVLQGAMIGAGVGGIYGAFSDRKTVLGGAIGGAMGGALGTAAFIHGRAGVRGVMNAARGHTVASLNNLNSAGRVALVEKASRAAWNGIKEAGKAEFSKAYGLGKRSGQLIGGTWGMAKNPIKSTLQYPVGPMGPFNQRSAAWKQRGVGIPSRGGSFVRPDGTKYAQKPTAARQMVTDLRSSLVKGRNMRLPPLRVPKRSRTPRMTPDMRTLGNQLRSGKGRKGR